MNIGIDIDDTINNCHEIIFEKGQEFNRTNNIYFQANPNEWAWDKAFGWDDELVSKFSQEYLENIWLNAKIKENAAEIINKLYEEGNRIIIITSRSTRDCKSAYNISKTWLDEKNIKYDKLIVGAEDKASICKKNNIDLFIDDHVDFCEGVSKTNARVLLFDSPYNQDEKRYKRVYSWKEVYENITNN